MNNIAKSNAERAVQNDTHEKDTVLTRKEAKAASPDDLSVSGEEDPGAALEDFVELHQ